jgi:hypothetical protein
MSDISLEQEIIEAVHKLNDAQKQHILEIARRLTLPEGEPGWKVIQHARAIGFSHEDLTEMAQAIEEWCERVDDFPEVNFGD